MPMEWGEVSTMELTKKLIDFRKSIDESMRPSWLRTTTITLTAKVPGVVFNHDLIHEVFKKVREIPVYYNGHKEPFIWKIFYSDFYNQMSIGYKDQLSTKKVKIFPNGSMQIAGCADCDDCDRFITQLRFLVNMFYKVDVPRESFEIVMYNGYFSLNHMIDVYVLMDTLNDLEIDFNYDPDRYAAVKVKMDTGRPKKVTVSIFVSGSVLVTGTKSPDEAFDVYTRIVQMVIETPGIFLEKNDMSEKFNVHLGYTIEEWENYITM